MILFWKTHGNPGFSRNISKEIEFYLKIDFFGFNLLFLNLENHFKIDVSLSLK